MLERILGGALGGLLVLAVYVFLRFVVHALYVLLPRLMLPRKPTPPSAPGPRFRISGDIEDIRGGGDGAYSLMGTWTAEEFTECLREAMQQPVREMLVQGRDPQGVGHVLKIQIFDADALNEDG